eukprot:CAMPEP_0178830112 /NCGR_PEP_ID=MMETSP0746-20121128/8741_1 /TAXON_ID=913974 /ORGANISM="Nitzschia punctata, Strain CCMP561" /LENGTH=482 /DNA_ID=CAMNT_0020492241 /DNA_START=130 /DNA_END=1578 /DNA_ORIENTATION=-
MSVCIPSMPNTQCTADNSYNNTSLSACYRWPDRFAKLVTAQVHQQVNDMLSGSRLTRNNNNIQLVRPGDIFSVDQVVGSGAFSQVSAVTTKDGRRYACKHLKQSLMERPEEFQLAAAELACEAHILSSFDHPNILKIRGWAENGIASFEEGQHNSFFLMLDLLDETLNQRIDRWRAEQQQYNLASSTLNHNNNNVMQHIMEHMRYQNLYLQKIRVMSQIASALEYIHSNGVIFRDLKPNNIGFIGDSVQIFDFGLSRELPALDTSIPFAMSGKVGTLRYMAPEVARQEHYNVSADIYSFSMVSYELLSLEKPYDGWTRDLHAELVCNRGLRPDTTNTCHPIPDEMKLLLEQSWCNNPASRGTMAQIRAQLCFLESKQVTYLAEQQLQMELCQQQQQQRQMELEQQQQQQRRQQQLQQQQLAQQLSMAAAAVAGVNNNRFYVDMSYCMAPSPPTKISRSMSVESIGTIETSSLSADESEGFFH